MNAHITVQHTEYSDIAQMRELFRHEAHCQVVRDSILRRGLADSYLFLVNGRRAGYGGVWNQHWPGRIMEFYILPHIRAQDLVLSAQIGHAFVESSGATHIEVQTNIPALLSFFLETTSANGENGSPSSTDEEGATSTLTIENFLFADDHATYMPPPTLSSGSPCVFCSLTTDGHTESVGEWGIEGDVNDGAGRRILAKGGFLTHYNPPCADIYMEVDQAARRKGVGAYLVQELKRVCYEAGFMPGARCDVNNLASLRTLQRAGLAVCGQVVSGAIRRD